jgi:folate-binding protein YgfZ
MSGMSVAVCHDTLETMPPPPFWVATSRDVVSVSGPDASTYLHSQLSQEVRTMGVGDSRWTFLLQPNGRVDVLARIWRTADEVFVLDTDAGYGGELAARLARFKIRVEAEIEPLEWRCISVVGSDPIDGGVVGWWNAGGDLLGPDVGPPAGLPAGSADDLETARVAAGWPAMGAEIVPGEMIPAETAVVLVAVDFKKGCYPGQELVERMDSRGADAPRRLRILAVGDDVPAGAGPGDPIRDASGAEVGTVTSVAGGAALGYVRRGVELGRPPTGG